MMAIAAGRFIKDGDVLFAGTGVAMLAATVAKRIHAPHAHIFFETGGIGPPLDELPMAVADPRVMAFSNLNAGLVEAFSYVANRRLHTIAFLGAAQIDRYGNMNSTVIGDYLAPKVRFSGSGGACDAGSLASGYIVFMQHGVQKFVEKLDYLTTPGWLERRRLAPAAPGTAAAGPSPWSPTSACSSSTRTTHEMYLAERYEGVTPEQVQENTGFALDVSRVDGGRAADRGGAAHPARRRRPAAPDPGLTRAAAGRRRRSAAASGARAALRPVRRPLQPARRRPGIARRAGAATAAGSSTRKLISPPSSSVNTSRCAMRPGGVAPAVLHAGAGHADARHADQLAGDGQEHDAAAGEPQHPAAPAAHVRGPAALVHGAGERHQPLVAGALHLVAQFVGAALGAGADTAKDDRETPTMAAITPASTRIDEQRCPFTAPPEAEGAPRSDGPRRPADDWLLG